MIEIEKKFLIRENGHESITAAFRKSFGSVDKLHKTILMHGVVIKQGYLPFKDGERIFADITNADIPFVANEVRLRQKGDLFFLTAKSTGGLERHEFEKKISESDFKKLWPITKGRRVEKMRWESVQWNLIYEFDNYLDRDLIVCEVELPSVESAQKVEPVGKDVTEIEKYKNKNLAK